MSFQISSLPASRFAHLFGKSDAELAAIGVIVQAADAAAGAPCRVTLRDSRPGDRVLLMNYEHQDAATPFRSSHAIFVIDGAEDAELAMGEVPEQMRARLLSVRAFSADGMILDADVVEGEAAPDLFEKMLGDPNVAYLHAHFARYGCYAARIDRA